MSADSEANSEDHGSSPSPFGALLRAYRKARGKSQLALSLDVGVSSRHLSFVETGRSLPGRDLVIALARSLGVPLRDRNVLLEAAGHARMYGESALDAEPMAFAREALERILGASMPHPSIVVNRRQDILLTNPAADALFSVFCVRAAEGRKNLARLLISTDGLRTTIENWDEVAIAVLGRTVRELQNLLSRTREDELVLGEIIPILSVLRSKTRPSGLESVMMPIRFRKGETTLNLFSFTATFGTPVDITLQEIRVETLFPSDGQSKESLRQLLDDEKDLTATSTRFARP